ncbi:AEC family transporter [Bacillus taeanensis]|uniref:AEC family transporter n=1 Tax=Bacillus taeanensis TaxID=273032 RepID=A0A366XRM7_9BACI|nr:AEC family transporter [Bacillus taeanensis]RBW68188.1 AEC family transporter [Bacillus taeanensis]
MEIFINVVLPVFLIFAAGFFIQKWKRLDIRSVSTVAIYVLSPCLVFRTFYHANLDAQYMKMVLFALALLFAIILLNKLYCIVRGYSSSVENALVLSTAFMNSGNYGAPIILFAFGEVGFAYSISFMVLQSVIMNFFGVYYAARGSAGFKLALLTVFKMPATYAVIMALFMQFFNIEAPANVFSAVDLVAEAAIPVVMLVLGMQLAQITLTNLEFGKITYASIMRLFLSPVIAALIIMILPMDPLLEKVLIVSAAMPTAATTTMYAVQFETEPELVSSITLVTTVLSILTITALLTFIA